MSDAADYDPVAHYDRVLDPWRYLLGDELHYGLFATGNEPLTVATNALTQRMIESADLSAGQRVLDVGCGTGAPACQLARDHEVSVLGIATSRVSVATATARAAREGLSDKVHFEVRDGADNKLPEEVFDRAWVLESSHLMRKKDRLIDECARVLRPDGQLVLCDIIRRRAIPFREVKERRADFLVLRSAFGDAHMDSLENYSLHASRAGLSVKRVDDLTEATYPTFTRWRDNAAANRAHLTEAMGAEDLASFVEACDILERFWRDGILGYGLLTAAKPQ